jgi:hypothetical protein
MPSCRPRRPVPFAAALAALAALATLAACGRDAANPTAPAAPPPDMPTAPMSVTYRWCSASPLVLAAYRDGSGPWQRLAVSDGAATFTVTKAVGTLVTVTGSAPSHSTYVYEGSANELRSLDEPCRLDPRTSTPLTVGPVSPGQTTITRSGASEQWLAGQVAGGFRTGQLITPAARGDLLALLVGSDGALDRVVVRRNVDYTAVSSIAVDFTAAESVRPDTVVAAVHGATDGSSLTYYLSGTGGYRYFFPARPVPMSGSVALPWLPVEHRRAGDRIGLRLRAPDVQSGALTLRRDASLTLQPDGPLSVTADWGSATSPPSAQAQRTQGTVRLNVSMAVPIGTRLVERGWWSNGGAYVGVFTSPAGSAHHGTPWQSLPALDEIPGWQQAFWPADHGTHAFSVGYYAWSGGGARFWPLDEDGLTFRSAQWSGPLH